MNEHRKPARIVRALRKLGIEDAEVELIQAELVHGEMLFTPLFDISYYNDGDWFLYGRGIYEGLSYSNYAPEEPPPPDIARRVERLVYVQRVDMLSTKEK